MSVGRRKSQVFVEIPFSPLHRREVLQQSSRSYIPSPVANVLSNKRANVQQQQQSKLDTFFSPSQNLKKRKLDNEMEDENKPFHGGAVKRSKVVDKEKGGQSGVVVIDLTVENAPIENVRGLILFFVHIPCLSMFNAEGESHHQTPSKISRTNLARNIRL
jgi:hypothetical protein